MYPVLISLVFSLLVLAMLPRDRQAFDPLDFVNPGAAAQTAEAEVHAHSMSIFAEALMMRLEQFPDSLPHYPSAVLVTELDKDRRYADVLPRAYRPTLPWQAYIVDDPARQGVAGVVVFLNAANLPPDMRPVDLGRALRLTAGNQTPVGLYRDGELLTHDFTNPNVVKANISLTALSGSDLHQNAVAIVVCSEGDFCKPSGG
jgi:hypothetical protein